MAEQFRTPLKPAEPYKPAPDPTPAPAWVSLVAAWGGLLVLVASIIFVFLPGTRDPVAELEKLKPASLADRFLPIPIYGCTLALCIGIIVLWQMRRIERPLPEPMVMQRLQAWAGIVLALLGAAVIYIDVAIRGPR